MAITSPFFQTIPLERYGVEWRYSPYAVAHPLDDGSAAALAPDFDTTAATLGVDGTAWRELMEPLTKDGEIILNELLGPFPLLPKHPIAIARFGLLALQPSTWLAQRRFVGEHARALFGGLAAHSMLGLEQPTSAAIGLMMGITGHMLGWPLPQGGTQRLTDALVTYFQSLGGEIAVDSPVRTLRDLPRARVALFDVTPRQLVAIAGAHGLPGWYQHQLGRFRYGPGVVKVDYALDGPVPWTAAECHAAATVHVGGTLAEIVRSESALEHGHFREQPFVLVVQPSAFDPTRAPQGKHTLWAYCHVPNGYGLDVSDQIEAQIERFAPGFRDLILARHVMLPADFQNYNSNYIGGDINGGLQDMRQIFTRPVPRLNPYRTPNPRLYLCSSSTPPGGGVHGMCGYHAARTVLTRFGQL